MVQILNGHSEGLNYKVGDIVYLWFDNGVPTCKVKFLGRKNGRYLFRAMEEQNFYWEQDGIIYFSDKPSIFAKETDERRAEK